MRKTRNISTKLKSPSRRPTAQRLQKDRRETVRAPLDVFMNRFSDGQPHLSLALDVSDSGMRLRPLSGPRLDGGVTGLQFQVPGSDTVHTASVQRVRESADGSIAVRFTHLDETARDALKAFVTSAA